MKLYIKSSNTENTAESIEFYHSSDSDSLRFDETVSNEVGMHCGTLEQAINCGNPYMYKIIVVPNFTSFYLKNDVGVHYNMLEFANELKNSNIIDETEWNNLVYTIRHSTYPPASTVYRNLLTSKGYDAFYYPNSVEGDGDSICIMSGDIISNIIYIGTTRSVNLKYRGLSQYE